MGGRLGLCVYRGSLAAEHRREHRRSQLLFAHLSVAGQSVLLLAHELALVGYLLVQGTSRYLSRFLSCYYGTSARR